MLRPVHEGATWLRAIQKEHSDMTQTETNPKPTSGTAADDVRKAGADIAGSMRDSARDAAGKISGDAANAAEQAQAGAADEFKDVASALRTAANEMRSGSPQDRAFSQLADSFADVSDALRDMDVGEMLGKASDFARRNPMAFMGGAALVGFTAIRLAKASAEGKSRGTSNGTGTGSTPTNTVGTRAPGSTSTMPTPGGTTEGYGS